MVFRCLFQPHGAQLIAAPQFVPQQSQQPNGVVVQQQQQQKRSAVADPKTGIPMAAYPVTAFSYPSPSPIPIQFQQQYLTAVPMACKSFNCFFFRIYSAWSRDFFNYSIACSLVWGKKTERYVQLNFSLCNLMYPILNRRSGQKVPFSMHVAMDMLINLFIRCFSSFFLSRSFDMYSSTSNEKWVINVQTFHSSFS